MDSGRKNNPDLLQEYEWQESKGENDDSDVNVESNKIDEDKNNMVISMEEEQKNLEYQKTMKGDVENIARDKKIGDLYVKLLIISFCRNIFSTRHFRQM